MQKHPLDMKNLHLYRDLLATVVQSRMDMEAASARADLLQNIFLVDIDVKYLGTEESFVERAINHLELDLLDARDAPERLRDATADMASAMWAYRMNQSGAADQYVRNAFERWKAIYLQSIGDPPEDTYMDIENARCLAENDFYLELPLPFVSRARCKSDNQNLSKLP